MEAALHRELRDLRQQAEELDKLSADADSYVLAELLLWLRETNDRLGDFAEQLVRDDPPDLVS